MASVCKDGKWGYVNDAGETVIPCQYKYAGLFSDNGLAFVENEEGSYECINEYGEIVIPNEKYSAYGNWKAYWLDANFASFDMELNEEDKLYGVINKEGEITNEAKEKVNMLLKKSFRPEFLNRLDEIIMFKPLTKENIGGIVEIQLRRLAKRLEQENLVLDISDKAKSYIAENGYDNVYGARPLKRFIQKYVETPIARYIIEKNPAAGSAVKVDADENGIFLK